MRVEMPVLKASMVGAMATDAGRQFHCTIVLGMKLCWMYNFVSLGMKNAKGCECLE